jgi:hypothetical protein
MRGKKNLWILSIILVLIVVATPILVKATVSNPVSGQVDLVWRYPKGLNYYPPGTSSFTLDIQSPSSWTNTSKGIIAYAFTVTTNSSFMKPIGVTGATTGYWLYDYVNKYVTINPGAYYPLIAKGTINSTTIPNLAEGLAQWSALGAGAGGNSSQDANGLITLNYQILNELTTTMRPTGEGTQTGWTATPKGTTKVTDVSDQNDKTGINATKASKTETFTFTQPSTENGTILSVNFYYRADYNGTTKATISPEWYFESTGDSIPGTAQGLTTTLTTYNQTETTNPDTSAPWTWSDLSSLEYGVTTVVGAKAPGTAYVSDLWYVVTYIPHPWDNTFMPIKLSAAAFYTVQGGTSTVYAFTNVATGNYNTTPSPPVPEFQFGPETAVEIGLISAVVYFLARRKTKPTVPKRFTTQTLSQ